MKKRAGRICIAVMLSLALIASVIVVSLLWSAPKGRAAETKAAMPEGVAPTETVTCGVCGKTAYRITTLAEFSHVVSQWGNGTEKTETCYVLDVPSADSETEKKVDVSGWADQSIGSASEAYTGHFDGNGYKIVYEVTGESGSGVQKQGLFPQLKDAEIRNFTAVVGHTVSSKDAAYRSGGVVSYAQNSVIEKVTVSETFTRNVNATAGAGGIAGEIDKTSTVKNCSVTTFSSGDHSAYGGIVATVAGGTVESCVFTLGGNSPRIGDFGGIARTLSVENLTEGTGNILGCKAYFPIAGATMVGNYAGGIVSVMYSGLISGCTAEVSVSGAEASTSGLGGIAGSVLTSTVAAEANRQTEAVIEDCYTYTRRDADGQIGKLIGRTNVGGLVGAVGDSNSRKHAVVIRNCKVQIANLGSAASGINNGGGLVGSAQTAALISIADCTADTNVYGTNGAGGLAGAIYLWTNGRLQMSNCHSYASVVEQVSGGDYMSAGGAIGVLTRSDGASNGSFHIIASSAWANVANIGKYGGGFIGTLTYSASKDNTIMSCSAYGNVSGVRDLGGFIGYSFFDGTNGDVSVINCTAFGDVTGSTEGKGANIGGFVGYNIANNSTFLGCAASGNVTGSNSIGGFVGYSGGSGIEYGSEEKAYGCTASGNVLGTGYAADDNRTKIGGFAGETRSSTETGMHVFNYCTASGAVEIVKYANMSGGMAGGFLGFVLGAKVNFCAAYGDVLLSGAGIAHFPGFMGGFVGRVLTVTGNPTFFSNCVAYGSVVTKQGNTYYLGGFAGELYNIYSRLTLTNCTSYGNVDGGASVVDIGSFLGHSDGWTTMTDCTAYGTVAGAGVGLGAWVGCVDGDSRPEQGWKGVTTLKNCKWVETKYSTVGRYLNGAGAPATDCGVIAAPVLPKVTVEKNGGATEEQGATTLAFTFSGCSGYGMKSMYLSLDGGKTYTQLVYNGIPLVAGMTAGGISDLEDGTMTISYAAKSEALNVKVRICLSSGSKEIIKTL